MIWSATNATFLVRSSSSEIINSKSFTRKSSYQTPISSRATYTANRNPKNSLSLNSNWPLCGINICRLTHRSGVLRIWRLKLVSKKKNCSIRRLRSKHCRISLKILWMCIGGESWKLLIRKITKESSRFKHYRGTNTFIQATNRKDWVGRSQGKPHTRQGKTLPRTKECPCKATGLLNPRTTHKIQISPEGKIRPNEEDEERTGKLSWRDEQSEVWSGPHQEWNGQNEGWILLA